MGFLAVAAWYLGLCTTACAAALAVFVLVCRRFVFAHKSRSEPEFLTIAWFHPFANGGGGGERVLWMALHGLQDVVLPRTQVEHVIYCGDADISLEEAAKQVESRFNISFTSDALANMRMVYITKRHLLDPSRYPRFTMIMQSLGSMVLAWECLRAYNPDIYVDTTGWAFTYFIAKVLAKCRVVNYTHYPTISSDMLGRVSAKVAAHNNASDVSKSKFKSAMKIVYYRLYAVVYGLMGRLSDVTMVNSHWTKNHIMQIWGRRADPQVVFPPCNTLALEAMPLMDGRDENLVVSVGQFRPEKDHALQLRAFAKLREMGGFDAARLVLAGGCRNDGDKARVEALKKLAAELNLGNSVEFRVNISFTDLCAMLGHAQAGLHTMWNEHFGISVVEMMAAGVITIAHNSGGPKSDIVCPFEGEDTGLLAATPDEYAAAMARVLPRAEEERKGMDSSGDEGGDDDDHVDVEAMRIAARNSVRRFSDEEFTLLFFSKVIGLIHTVHEENEKVGRR